MINERKVACITNKQFACCHRYSYCVQLMKIAGTNGLQHGNRIYLELNRVLNQGCVIAITTQPSTKFEARHELHIIHSDCGLVFVGICCQTIWLDEETEQNLFLYHCRDCDWMGFNEVEECSHLLSRRMRWDTKSVVVSGMLPTDCV